MKKLNEDIGKSIFYNIYLLTGEEGYLRKQYMDKLKKSLCGDNSMNIDVFRSAKPDLSEIRDLAMTLPFLGDKRVIVIEDSKLFEVKKGEEGAEGGEGAGVKGSEATSDETSSEAIDDAFSGSKRGGGKQKTQLSSFDAFVKFLDSIPETTHLIFSEEKVDKRSKLYKTIDKKGYVANFPLQDASTLVKWIGKLAANEGVGITGADASYLVQRVGNDMTNLKGEWEKLLCYAMDSPAVTKAHIDAVCSPVIEDKVFEMIDAMSAGKGAQALRQLEDLVALDVHPLKVISLLERHFRIIYRLGEYQEEGVLGKNLALKLNVPPFAIGKYSSQYSRYGAARVRRALDDCVRAEHDIKSGKMEAVTAVELIIAGYSG